MVNGIHWKGLCSPFDPDPTFSSATPLPAISPVEEEEAGGLRREAPRGPAVDAGRRTAPTSSKPGRWSPHRGR